MTIRRALWLLGLPLLAGCAGPGALRTTPPVPTVTVGIAAFNDFHGALEPPHIAVSAPGDQGATVQVPAGGAAWFASALDMVRSRYRYHLTLSAGDLIGASQPASSLFLDEPTVGTMNRIGLDYNAAGNHEFDRGQAELLRMQHGGCARHTLREPCQVERFGGARFGILTANTLTEAGQPLLPGYAIRGFGRGRMRVKLAVIGLTLQRTAELAPPGGIRGLRFSNEAETVNALVPRLKAASAAAVIVLIHQGGAQASPGDPNGCEGFSGEIRPILDALDPRVDLVISGHTHRAYVCDYARDNPAKPFLLTSAGSQGAMVTEISLEIDPRTRRVVAKHAVNRIVQSFGFNGSQGPVPTTTLVPQMTPRADIAAYVRRYADAARAAIERPAGRLAGPAGGIALANLVADAQLAATRQAGAQIALTNPFGVRAALNPATDGSVNFGALYAVQPFANGLVTQSLTGAELKAVLEQGFDGQGQEQALVPSSGLAYSFDLTRPPGARIVAMTLDGVPVDPVASYRVTTNSFLAEGGDGFTALARQHGAVTGVSDLDALEAWLKGDPARAVPVEERVRTIEP